MDIVRSVTVAQPLDTVFAYLSDFTTTNEWDPGTVRTERVSGDGGLGSRYHNVSKFLGRETELDYLVIEHVPGERFALRGENATVVANDTMTFMRSHTAEGEGTTVTYHAAFEFKGVAKLIAPLLAPALKKLGDEAEAGMQDALGRLGRQE
ncbi:SRPBCC family protein [Humibacillus xanthopallidus]|uniref:Polyketide cyclase/dehydrase/lipid transport protein n=1 Tax=Humibacillus xanthopallidus TaxID=412689 RepID=A0A543I2Y6_9MICO|nr:SRPBCC family protein [Humibacillus xanthopallidus]TQM64959.1 polyketide cyclase/dehydrase/lipid transport protein [Humibacillus xanthopallidus]